MPDPEPTAITLNPTLVLPPEQVAWLRALVSDRAAKTQTIQQKQGGKEAELFERLKLFLRSKRRIRKPGGRNLLGEELQA